MKAALTRARPEKTKKVQTKQDFATILMTAPGYTASKRFVRTASGIEKVDFNAGTWFKVMVPQAVADIVSLSEVLTAIEAFPNMLIIRGAPAEQAYIGAWKRRKGSGDEGNFFTPPAGRSWVLIDFDKIEIPKHLSLQRDSVEVCEYLIGLLPAEFHNVSYHWQMSSSAGIGDPRRVSMHIWFWLTKPVPDESMNAWAKHVNDQARRAGKATSNIVDPSLFQHVQPHYTAAPIFEGMPNPFPKRSGLRAKKQDAVDLILPATAPRSAPIRTANTRTVSGTASDGSGFVYHLSRIGDHPGGDGFHAPIVAAAASYVSTHGAEGTDAEVLFEIISAAVLAADATHHSRADIESRASREHILPAICSALKKFGAARSKLHTDCAPHFSSDPISAAAATQRLEDLAKLV